MKSGILEMRFRRLFAAVQIVVSIALVWVPLGGYFAYQMRLFPAKDLRGNYVGRMDSCRPLPNLWGIDSVVFATGANLPAFAIVAPVILVLNEYSHSELPHDWVHDPFLRSFGASLVGIAVWFFLGRLLDDLLVWCQRKIRPPVRVADFLFVLATGITSTLAVTGWGELPQGAVGVWFAVWIVFWIVVGYSGTAVRVIQLIHIKRDSRPAPKSV